MEKCGLLVSARNINALPSANHGFKTQKLSSNFARFPGSLGFSPGKYPFLAKRISTRGLQSAQCAACFLEATVPSNIELSLADMTISGQPFFVHEAAKILRIDASEISHGASELVQRLVLVDLDPATAKLAIGFLGPFLSAFSFLFILRIVMSWYPKLPVGKFPFVIAYAPTEPLLILTRRLIPPLGGVDVTPVVWFGLISFLNEILVGPQGLLVLISQQV